MLSLEAAVERILSELSPLPLESAPLADVAGRYAAQPVIAPADLPFFDNSAMDGYAVQAADVAHANKEQPTKLTLIGSVAAGEIFSGEVKPGTCVRIFTGSALPKGADAVVMQEDTSRSESAPTEVTFHDTVKPWENVRFSGEDVKQGSTLLATGERIGFGALALLAANGIAQVSVHRSPKVGVLATGSELCEPGHPRSGAQIYESNRTTLTHLLKNIGAVPTPYPLVADTLDATRQALEKAIAENDVVLTSGGVSVGELDFVKAAFRELGGQIDFWRVAIKPGKPFVFGKVQGKYLFGLPGNPVSALVTYLLLVRPALLHLQGARETSLPQQTAVLTEPLVNRGDRRHFMRVTVTNDGRVASSGTQASHMLASLAKANGLVDVPPATTLAAGTSVSVLRWE